MFRLREIRKQKNMSQEELSKKAGVSRTIISRLESDNCYVTTTSTILKLARALEVSPGDILFDVSA